MTHNIQVHITKTTEQSHSRWSQCTIDQRIQELLSETYNREIDFFIDN